MTVTRDCYDISQVKSSLFSLTIINGAVILNSLSTLHERSDIGRAILNRSCQRENRVASTFPPAIRTPETEALYALYFKFHSKKLHCVFVVLNVDWHGVIELSLLIVWLKQKVATLKALIINVNDEFA